MGFVAKTTKTNTYATFWDITSFTTVIIPLCNYAFVRICVTLKNIGPYLKLVVKIYNYLYKFNFFNIPKKSSWNEESQNRRFIWLKWFKEGDDSMWNLQPIMDLEEAYWMLSVKHRNGCARIWTTKIERTLWSIFLGFC